MVFEITKASSVEGRASAILTQRLPDLKGVPEKATEQSPQKAGELTENRSLHFTKRSIFRSNDLLTGERKYGNRIHKLSKLWHAAQAR
jgi:hypothetical protein